MGKLEKKIWGFGNPKGQSRSLDSRGGSVSREMMGMVVHAYNPSTGEVEAGRAIVQGQPGLGSTVRP
jgi:hypothetical protein